jgi:hypothetical protein
MDNSKILELRLTEFGFKFVRFSDEKEVAS